MKLHGNAPFGPKGRLTMARLEVVGRYRSEGEAGRVDRSSPSFNSSGPCPWRAFQVRTRDRGGGRRGGSL
jgi:hypothetical protein